MHYLKKDGGIPHDFVLYCFKPALWKACQQQGREPDISVIPACLNVATVDMKINNDHLPSQVETFHPSHYKIIEPNRTQ